jgi:proline iminopeptidase
MTFARLCAHYFSHAAWLEDGQLLRDARRLSGIPGVLIHGRFDLGGPPDVPWLHRAWPGSELHPGPDRSHRRRRDDRSHDGRAGPLRPDPVRSVLLAGGA